MPMSRTAEPSIVGTALNAKPRLAGTTILSPGVPCAIANAGVAIPARMIARKTR